MMRVAFFQSATCRQPMNLELTWDEFVSLMRESAEIPAEPSDKLHTMGFSLVGYPEGSTRSKASVASIYGLAVDLDTGDIPFSEAVSHLKALGLSFVAHTTTKSTAEVNRYRVIVPLSRVVTAEEYPALYQAVSRWTGHRIDPACKDASRLWIVPRKWAGSFHAFASYSGVPLDPERLIRRYPAPIERVSHPVEIPSWENADGNLETDPICTVAFRDAFCSEPKGGRLWRFMLRCACRALAMNLPVTVKSLASLADEMNRRGPNGRPGRDLRREASRALETAAQWVGNRQPTNQLSGVEALRLMKNRKQIRKWRT